MASFWEVFLLPTLVAAAAIVFILLREDGFEPQAYELPPPPKLDGPLASNNRLRNAQLLLKGQISGPESILVEGDTLYTGTWDGKVLQIVNGVIRKTIRFTEEKVCDNKMEQPPSGGATGAMKAYEIRVAEEAGFYKYRVSVVVQEDFEVSQELTGWTQDTDDGYKCLQAALCRDLLQTFFFMASADVEELVFAYDGRKTFYTNRPLPDALVKPTTVNADVMSDHVSKKLNNAPVIVTLKADNNNNEFKLRDLLAQAAFGCQRAKRELLAFFACLSDEAALQSEDYTSVCGQLYGEDDTEFERGIVIRGGVRRGIRIPDGKNKLETPLYVADVRNCTFYKDQTVVQSLREVVGRFTSRDKDQILQHFLRLYRGVRCRLTYAPHETFTIDAYGRDARDIEIPQPDGPPISMADHFRKTYNVRLVDDSLPTIRMAGDTAEHPLDVMDILPHQRVQIDAVDQHMANVLLDLNSPDGETRIEELNAHMDAILGPTSASLMAAFGIATSYPTAVPHTPNTAT